MTTKTVMATVRFTVRIPIVLEDWELSRLEEGIDHVNEITDRDLLAEAKTKVPALTIDDVDLDWEHADEIKG